jgi:hypothetical protein
MNWVSKILNDYKDENEELAFKIAYDFASYLDKIQIDYIEFANKFDMNIKDIKSVLIGDKVPDSILLKTIELKANTKIFRDINNKDINLKLNDTERRYLLLYKSGLERHRLECGYTHMDFESIYVCSWWLRNDDPNDYEYLGKTTKEINKQLNKLVKKNILHKDAKQGVATFYYPSDNYNEAIKLNNIK